MPGIIGCLQALEAIKIASSVGEPLSGRMLLLDSLSAKIRIVSNLLRLFLVFSKSFYCGSFYDRDRRKQFIVLCSVFVNYLKSFIWR